VDRKAPLLQPPNTGFAFSILTPTSGSTSFTGAAGYNLTVLDPLVEGLGDSGGR